jgi:uncharacterized protein YlxW (UPF0749 family)
MKLFESLCFFECMICFYLNFSSLMLKFVFELKKVKKTCKRKPNQRLEKPKLTSGKRYFETIF